MIAYAASNPLPYPGLPTAYTTSSAVSNCPSGPADIAVLSARLDELASPDEGLEELRAEIATLDARLNAIPAPTDEWRIEPVGG